MEDVVHILFAQSVVHGERENRLAQPLCDGEIGFAEVVDEDRLLMQTARIVNPGSHAAMFQSLGQLSAIQTCDLRIDRHAVRTPSTSSA